MDIVLTMLGAYGSQMGLSYSEILQPRKTKIGTEVVHVTRDSDTTVKVKRSRSQGAGHIVAASRIL